MGIPEGRGKMGGSHMGKVVKIIIKISGIAVPIKYFRNLVSTFKIFLLESN